MNVYPIYLPLAIYISIYLSFYLTIYHYIHLSISLYLSIYPPYTHTFPRSITLVREGQTLPSLNRIEAINRLKRKAIYADSRPSYRRHKYPHTRDAGTQCGR